MSRITAWLRQAWLILVLGGAIIAADQFTKVLVRTNLPKYEFVPVLGEYFGWQHVDNFGAAFGILQGRGWFFSSVAVVVAIAILIYVRYLPPDQRFVRIVLGMQLGGAIGNLIDRIRLGHVTDFVRMGIPGRFIWPNYNIADSAIVLGVIGLGVYVIWHDLRVQRREEANNAVVDQKPLTSDE